jgi:hypothetical protein
MSNDAPDQPIATKLKPGIDIDVLNYVFLRHSCHSCKFKDYLLNHDFCASCMNHNKWEPYPVWIEIVKRANKEA